MGTAIVSILVIALFYTVDGCPVVSSINGSCCEIKSDGFKFSLSSQIASGIYSITNLCGNCQSVAQGYCDATSDKGGWLVVQRRKDGSVSFNRGWVEYEQGFGDLTGEFWYGLQPLHCLTSQGQWELRIDLTHSNGSKTYLHYKKFAVGPASDKYPLQISLFNGIYPIDPFTRYPLNGMKFSTRDSDNDRHPKNCALTGDGINSFGWWYNACSWIHLNRQYSVKQTIYTGSWQYYPFVEMKIKPANCN